MKSLLVTMVVLLMAITARADVAVAKRAYEKGLVAYNLQQFGDALELFRRAYQERQDPAFLFNIGQCQRQLGRFDEAAKSYRAYLSTSPETPGNAVQVRALIVDMEAAKLPRHAPEPPAAPAVAPGAVYVMPAAALDLAPRRWYQNPVGWTVLGVGVAGVAASIGLFAHANDLDHQLGSASSLVQVQQLQSDRNTYQTAGIASVAIGGAALVAGAVVLGVMAKRHPTKAAWILPSPSPSGVVFAAGGAW